MFCLSRRNENAIAAFLSAQQNQTFSYITPTSGFLGNKRRRDMLPTTIESNWVRVLRHLNEQNVR